MANVGQDKTESTVIEEMAERIVLLQPCWMEDVFEIAFKELVLKEKFSHIPEPSPKFVNQVLQVKKTDSEFLKWASERRHLKKQSARQRIDGQNLLIEPGGFKEVNSEREFFAKMVTTIRSILSKPQTKIDMLETILGDIIRPRHPTDSARIDEAFEQYTPQTFTSYPLTLNCWIVRLFYVYAPLVKIRAENTNLRKILGRSLQDQSNNPEDEQYVISALACNQLLTADAGMRNVMRLFQDGQFTRCKTVFVERSAPLEDQIPALLL